MEKIKDQIAHIMNQDVLGGETHVYITDIGLKNQTVKDLFAEGKGVARVSDIPQEIVNQIPEIQEKVAEAIAIIDGVSSDLKGEYVKTATITEAVARFKELLGSLAKISGASAPYLQTSLIEELVERHYASEYNNRLKAIKAKAELEGSNFPDEEWADEEFVVFHSMMKDRLKQIDEASGLGKSKS